MLKVASFSVCILLSTLLFVIGVRGEGHEQDSAKTDPLSIVVTVEPIAQIVKDMAGDLVNVETLIPIGHDPHHHAMKPSDLKRIHHAEGVIWLGPTLEPFLQKSIEALPEARRLSLEAISTEKERHEHSETSHESLYESLHKEVHQDGIERVDPHIWLSIDDRSAMITAISNWLQKQSMGMSKESIQARADAMHEQGQALRLLKGHVLEKKEKRRPILLDHNAFGYLLDELDLVLVGAIQRHHEIKPSIKHLAALSLSVQQAQPLCVITQPNTDEKLLKKILNGTEFRRYTIDPMLKRGSVSGLDSMNAFQSVVEDLLACSALIEH